MKRTAYLDCFAGICGSMLLGALVDAGLEPDDLRGGLSGLALSDYEITFEPAMHSSIKGTLARVRVSEKQPERRLSDIEALLNESTLPPDVLARALRVFRSLGAAEARVHGVSLEEVHFHEVGAVDAIVDIVGSLYGFARLGVTEATASPIPTGAGFVRTMHGLLPVPAPAVAELLTRVPSYAGTERAELTTPTGAAILRELCQEFGPRPFMSVERIGYGAGEHRLAIPNFLRLFLGTPADRSAKVAPAFTEEAIWLLETLVDDATPELIAETQARLMARGALDAIVVPVIGKKGRAAVMLSVQAATEADARRLSDLIFRELPTLGVRFREERRFVLERSIASVDVAGGSVRLKISRVPDGTVVTVAPEFEDCRRLAEASGASVRSVYEAALQAYRAGRAHQEKREL